MSPDEASGPRDENEFPKIVSNIYKMLRKPYILEDIYAYSTRYEFQKERKN